MNRLGTRTRRIVEPLIFALCLSLGLSTATTSAQTLDSIKSNGALLVGVQSDFPPWGFTDASMTLVGYDIDVAKLMAEDMGVKLQTVPVTPANRIAYLTSSKVDVLAAAIGMYPERAKAVQFSKPYSALDAVVYGVKSQPVHEWKDLEPLRFGVARGNAVDIAATKALPASAKIMRFDDDATSLQALLAGQVDAIGTTNLVVSSVEKTPAAARFTQMFLISRQYNGMASRQGQKEINQWLNAFVDRNVANGKLGAINRKWIGSDLPQLPAELAGIPFTVQ